MMPKYKRKFNLSSKIFLEHSDGNCEFSQNNEKHRFFHVFVCFQSRIFRLSRRNFPKTYRSRIVDYIPRLFVLRNNSSSLTVCPQYQLKVRLTRIFRNGKFLHNSAIRFLKKNVQSNYCVVQPPLKFCLIKNDFRIYFPVFLHFFLFLPFPGTFRHRHLMTYSGDIDAIRFGSLIKCMCGRKIFF